MNKSKLTKYKLWFYEDDYWKYNKGYFEEIPQALEWAEHWKVNGVLEEWLFEKEKKVYREKQCTNMAPFIFDQEMKNVSWEYKKWNRDFPCPGYVFNYYKKFVDKEIKIDNLVDVLFKDDKKGLVA